jgi:glutathione S-transferase
MEASLSKSTWFCGEALTAADIQMSFAVEAAEVRADIASDYPNIERFLKQMRALPAYQSAIEKGGPYSLLGAADSNG